MKKIVYIVSTLRRTGPVNVLYNFLKYIDRKRFKPVIITLSSEPENSMLEEFRKLSIEVISLNLSRMEGFFIGGKRLKQTILNIEPDIIHNNGYRPAILTSIFLSDITKVTTIHNVPFEDYPMTYGKVLGGVMSCTELMSLKKMNANIACSFAVKEKIENKKKLNIDVIHNGVDTEIFHPISYDKKIEIRKKLNLDEKSKIFVCVGNISKRKNPIFLIEAFKKAFPNKEVVLLIVGVGELLEECIKIVGEHTNISFAGYAKDPIEYFQAADFYVSSSLSEGLPTSVIEGLSVGLPSLLSDIPQHREIINLNKEIGMLFDVESVEDLVEKLRLIVSKDYNKLSSLAVQTVKNNLTAKLMAEGYEKLYEKLLSKVRV